MGTWPDSLPSLLGMRSVKRGATLESSDRKLVTGAGQQRVSWNALLWRPKGWPATRPRPVYDAPPAITFGYCRLARADGKLNCFRPVGELTQRLTTGGGGPDLASSFLKRGPGGLSFTLILSKNSTNWPQWKILIRTRLLGTNFC